MIKSTGFFRAKTDTLWSSWAPRWSSSFAGEVPDRLDELVTLPGVGRKTANVVLGNAFGVPGITVDTHFGRLARRFGWTDQLDPVKVEAEVGALFPRRTGRCSSHRHLARPAPVPCPQAGLRCLSGRSLCPSFGEGETDPKKAAKLVREPRG